MKTTGTTTSSRASASTTSVSSATASATAAARTRRPPGRGDRRGPGHGPGHPLRRPRPAQPHELFAERLLAVLSGRRPVHWMLGQTVGVAYEQLVRLAPGTPLRARGTDPVVRACRYFRPGPGVVEAAASIAAGDQVRAMAFRLEQGADLRWRCAAVEIGGDRAGAAEAAEATEAERAGSGAAADAAAES